MEDDQSGQVCPPLERSIGGDQANALKALEAKVDGHVDRLAQIEEHGRMVSANVDLLSTAVDGRFNALTADLNQLSGQLEQSKAAVENGVTLLKGLLRTSCPWSVSWDTACHPGTLLWLSW